MSLHCTHVMLQEYESKHQEEDELNEQLNTFSANCKTAYGGLNTIREQIGQNSDSRKALIDRITKTDE